MKSFFVLTAMSFVAIAANSAIAQTLNVLASFDGGIPLGAQPGGDLTLSGSTLFGVTDRGSNFNFNDGTIFSIGVNGTNYQNLFQFNGSTLTSPEAALVVSGSTLYGSCGTGNGDGAIFSIGDNGYGTNFQTLLSFTGTSGQFPGMFPGDLSLVGSTLFGLTSGGTAASYLFSVGVSGSNFQNLYSFSGGTNGNNPVGSLTLIGSTFYGMTNSGGTNGAGNIFCVGTNGQNYRNLFSFSGSNGSNPNGSLTLSGSTFYGTTLGGSHFQAHDY